MVVIDFFISRLAKKAKFINQNSTKHEKWQFTRGKIYKFPFSHKRVSLRLKNFLLEYLIFLTKISIIITSNK